MNDMRGSWWRRWDLHFHTPHSYDYKDKSVGPADIVSALVKQETAVVAITDHNSLDVQFISALRAAAQGTVTVLPGIELTSNLGGPEAVHFIALFPEDVDLEHLKSELMVKLDLAQKRMDGIAQECLYVDFGAAVDVIKGLDGLISIHGHGKAANFESITSALKFKQQQKTDLLRNDVDIIEVGDIRHAATYREKIFPEIEFARPMVVASDNHNAREYVSPVECWIKADPTFLGLRMALREPDSRFCIGSRPAMLDRLDKNKTRYIEKVVFSRRLSMPVGEQWMSGEVPFNPGLVAIIGNKGSGKSALTDCIGLLGSCTTSEASSFLDDKHFRHPKTGRAQHVEATLHWHDGAPRTRLLSEKVTADEPERVKYLPQNFVEATCNDLESPGGGEFEKELKKVVFSKVPKGDQLGKGSLDELVQYRTEEIRQKAEALVAGLRADAIQRAGLEAQLDPAVRSRLEKRAAQIREDIASHDASKPEVVAPPATAGVSGDASGPGLEELERLKGERAVVLEEVSGVERTVAAKKVRAADGRKLLEKLANLQAEFDRRFADIRTDARALGLDETRLAVLKIDRVPVDDVVAAASREGAEGGALLDGPLPTGLRARGAELEQRIKDLQETLDRPNQEYQANLQAQTIWQARRDALVGADDQPESLKGVEAAIAGLAQVPAKIAAITSRQEAVARSIHEAREAEAAVFTELYGPVQRFIETHPLAKNQLNLEFKVELVEERFVDGLLSHINQAKMGSFCGVEEGRMAAQALAAIVDWADWNQVSAFLNSVARSLHVDQRSGARGATFLHAQTGKGKTPEDLYAWLYGLSYIRPRYILRWDGKGVGQLSPGERGALLLVFYLLIDESDLPLVIDQPEANLDNVTVARKLVGCIRHARERRQVVIVTHNPNLAVVCDADQIVHAAMDKTAGNKMTYECGGLEHPLQNRYAIDVLEGGRQPFTRRSETYIDDEKA